MDPFIKELMKIVDEENIEVLDTILDNTDGKSIYSIYIQRQDGTSKIYSFDIGNLDINDINVNEDGSFEVNISSNVKLVYEKEIDMDLVKEYINSMLDAIENYMKDRYDKDKEYIQIEYIGSSEGMEIFKAYVYDKNHNCDRIDILKVESDANRFKVEFISSTRYTDRTEIEED